MDSTEKITRDQIAKNFEQAFKELLEPPKYDKGLHKVLEIFDTGNSVSAAASFNVEENDTFSVNVDVQNGTQNFMGNSAPLEVSNPQGGNVNGTVTASANLYADTSKFIWYEGSILTIYFQDESGDFLGLFSGSVIPQLNPDSGQGTGSWLNPSE